MNISEALRRIKKLKGVVAQESGRMKTSVSHLENEPPAFDFKESLLAYEKAKSELVSLEGRLAKTNGVTTIDFGGKKVSLAEAIRQLQELRGDITLFKELVLRNSVEKTKESSYDEDKEKYVYTTVTQKWVSAISEREREEAVNNLETKFEALNNAVEKANHSTSLVD
ncbi:MAG: DIP1984 family protein [Chitinophagales bacterium]|nr:DIP1984 family protein [Chitinophagales bacterium]